MAEVANVASLALRIRKLQQLLPTEARPLKPHELTALRKLDRLREQWRWLLLIDGHYHQGRVSGRRANELRGLVLRGESIANEPLDDTPSTRRWAKERRRVSRTVAATAAQHSRRLAGSTVPRRAPGTTSRARAGRATRRIRSSARRGPPGRLADDDPEPPLARFGRLRALVDARARTSRVWRRLAVETEARNRAGLE